MTEWALNQRCEWLKCSEATNIRGETAYGEPVTVKCRFTPMSKRAVDLMGNTVVIDCSVLADAKMEAGDLVLYDGVTYEITQTNEPHAAGGDYIGRFNFGRRTDAAP